jgi:flavin reductase (DIM6/NTAB) family NADH-FMN oxidoreductase RutF
MKVQLGPTNIFFPVPAALVVSGSMEKPNIITVAWIGMMSASPPTIAISLKKNRYSLDLIRQTKEFTVNISSAEQFKETDYCGLVSGKNTDKFEHTNFTPIASQKIGAPIIEQCPFNLECRVIREDVELGQWVAIFGEIVETHIDEDKIDLPSKAIDIAKVNPLVYCATIREYWQLDKKIGKGFGAGKDLVKDRKND